MLIALFTILILGGSSTGMLDFISDSRDEVRAVMERGERRSEALAILRDIKKRTESRNKVVSNAAEDLREVLQQQQVSDSDINTVWYRYFAQREAYNKDMIDLRFRFREQLTREEWEQVFDHR